MNVLTIMLRLVRWWWWWWCCLFPPLAIVLPLIVVPPVTVVVPPVALLPLAIVLPPRDGEVNGEVTEDCFFL